MCGFTGFLNLANEARRSDMQARGRAMADTLRHRGPDDGQVWIDDNVPLVFAFRRLSIIDLSPEGRQPMRSASGRYTIVFNGEIYNFLNLRKELERSGVQFRGRSDTETILAAVEAWGLNQTLQKINGMFAFVIWDAKERKLHFARDRLGKKPLYVGWAEGALVFASELKALRAHPGFKAAINPEALSLFLQYGYVPSPSCIYKNVWSLPAGHRLALGIEGLQQNADLESRMEPYWHHTRVVEDARSKKIGGGDEAVINEFEELLTECVRDRLISDVPLGAFFSGGIDSSSVVALMQRISGQKVKTYTIGFHEEGFDEAAHAKKIAAHLGTDHHEIYLSAQDALNVIPRLPEIYDEPFADMSAIPTYLVSQFARRDVTVALSGDGGDEMLGGYNRHVTGAKLWNRIKFLPKPLRRAVGSAIKTLPPERWNTLIKNRPQAGILMHKAADLFGLNTQEEIYQSLLGQWPTPPVANNVAVKTLLSDSDFQPPHDFSFAEKMMYWDALFYLPGDILTKVDRASMAVSLEARAPLLDRRIYEYAWRLPERFKMRGGQGKWLLRQVLKRHVPEELFERPKQGFAVPVGAWLRGPLKDWAENLLSTDRLEQSGLDAGVIRAAWQDHLENRGSNAQKLWGALMFQAWHERWIN
ncbi:MAG: asparagine synthase (glutamine-hydrolyzing) [Alphaproteobacteria bacterium]